MESYVWTKLLSPTSGQAGNLCQDVVHFNSTFNTISSTPNLPSCLCLRLSVEHPHPDRQEAERKAGKGYFRPSDCQHRSKAACSPLSSTVGTLNTGTGFIQGGHKCMQTGRGTSYNTDTTVSHLLSHFKFFGTTMWHYETLTRTPWCSKAQPATGTVDPVLLCYCQVHPHNNFALWYSAATKRDTEAKAHNPLSWEDHWLQTSPSFISCTLLGPSSLNHHTLVTQSLNCFPLEKDWTKPNHCMPHSLFTPTLISLTYLLHSQHWNCTITFKHLVHF